MYDREAALVEDFAYAALRGCGFTVELSFCHFYLLAFYRVLWVWLKVNQLCCEPWVIYDCRFSMSAKLFFFLNCWIFSLA